MSYFNTNNERGEVLAASNSNASRQNRAVLAVFRQNPHAAMAPHEVATAVGSAWPLTSIRRAITTLTNNGLLEKTGDRVVGTYGKRVHTWRLRQQ